MKKLISFSVFVVILITMLAAKSQAQTPVIVVRHPSVAIAGHHHLCSHRVHKKHHPCHRRTVRVQVRTRNSFPR